MTVIRLLLEHGADVNLRNNEQETPLYLASKWPPRSPVPMLLSHGGELDIFSAIRLGKAEQALDILRRDRTQAVARLEGTTPLELAADWHCANLIGPLVAAGADPNLPGSRGRTPLHRARGDLRTMEALLKAGADPNAGDGDGPTVLQTTVVYGGAEGVRLLLAHGAQPDIFSAAMMGDIESVERMLAADSALANAIVPRSQAFAPLYAALKEGHEEVADLLLAKGARINSDLLLLAVADGNAAAVDWLLERTDRSIINDRDRFGRLPLQKAANGGHADVAKVLVKHGASLDALDRLGEPAVYAAIGDPDTLAVLLDAGADPNARNRWDETALHGAAPGNKCESVRLLLAAGADPNARAGALGLTPLYLAARANSGKAVQILLDAGADPNIASYPGRTPLDRASQDGFTDVVGILLAAQASSGAVTTNRGEALAYAAAGGYTDTVEVLLRHGVDPNGQARDGRTALHVAASNDHFDVVKLLLENGADPNLKDGSGHRPLRDAVEGRPTAELLRSYGARE
jgi:ankyrin repeat protein